MNTFSGKIGRTSGWISALILLPVLAGGAYWAGARRIPPAPTLALIPQTAGAMVWDAEHAGATDAAETLHYRLHWNAPTSENDVAGQVSLIDKVSRGSYAGLVLAPNHPLAVLTPLRHVLEAGLPVLVVASELDLPAGGKLAYIVNDEEQMGALAAARMAVLLNGKGEIALAGVGRNAPGAIRRARSAEAFLATHFPNIQVVSRFASAYNTTRAEEVTNTALDAHPDLKGIVGITAAATRGVRAAIMSQAVRRHVALVGCEQDTELISAVRAGEMGGIVVEDSYFIGHRAVELIAAVRAGRAIPPKTTVQPVLITPENVTSPEITRLLGSGRWKRE